MEKYFYVRYFKKTCGIWIFLVFSIYCMFACSFEVLHLGIFSINAPKDYIDKINDIIKNLSYSYIAGCFFFFLSDTIPFLRRQKIAIKNVSKSITSIKEELKRTEIKLTGYNWNQTETKKIWEEISSYEYSDNLNISIILKLQQLKVIHDFINYLFLKSDYILSQELYISNRIYQEISRFRTDDILLKIVNMDKEEKYSLSNEDLIKLIKTLLEIHSISE